MAIECSSKSKLIGWIVKAKSEGKFTNYEVASIQGISTSRVQRLYREYKGIGTVPVLKRAGSPPYLKANGKPSIIDLYEGFRFSASYIGMALRGIGTHIDNNKILEILKEEGLAMSAPRKYKGRKRIRYEREHSNSLWHVDWHEINKGSKVEGDVAHCIRG